MPTHTTLASLFTDIANAIRNKTGGSASIVADNFPSAIASIPTGGGGASLGTKSISSNGTYYASTDGYDGYSQVSVSVPSTGTDTSDATLIDGAQIMGGYTAYARGQKFFGTMAGIQATSYTPGTADITLQAGKYLAGAQTILGDPNLIASNIRSGVTIFDVTGTYTGGGGGVTPWTVSDLSPEEGDSAELVFPSASPIGDIGAWILYTKASRTPSANVVVAMCGTPSSGKSFASFNASGSSFISSSPQGVRVTTVNNNVIVTLINSMYTFDGLDYGLIVVHGGTGTLTLRGAEATPSSGQTQVTFTGLAAAPKLYMCALYAQTAYDSSHRVHTVAYLDNSVLCATNFYTNNAVYYGSGFTSSMSGSSLTIASNGQNAGGYFHSGLYKLFYLTATDLEGS